MEKRFRVIECKKDRVHVVVDTFSGKTHLETENPATANAKAEELNWLNDL